MIKNLPDLRPDSLLLSRGSRLLLFACAAILGYILTGLLTTVLIYKFGAASPRVLRIAALGQDILALIAPAVITAAMVTRLPAQLLEIRGGVSPRLWVAALAIIIVAAPAMNVVISLNESIEFTGALAPLMDALRTMPKNFSSAEPSSACSPPAA